MSSEIRNENIFECSVDSPVLPASKSPKIYIILEGQVYKKSGEKEFSESQKYKLKHLYNKLKSCYVKALNNAEQEKMTSVVFPVLDADNSKFLYDWSIEIAERTVKQYSEQNPDSSIKEIILIKYDKAAKYRDNLKALQDLRKQPEPKSNSEIVALYSQYQEEAKDFYDEMQSKKSEGIKVPKDIHQEFNDSLYKRIFNANLNITYEEFAPKVPVSPNKISGIKNLKKEAAGYLRDKDNVIAVGKALNLNFNDLCYFVWSRGHCFPMTDTDYKLISAIREREIKELERKESYEEKSDI